MFHLNKPSKSPSKVPKQNSSRSSTISKLISADTSKTVKINKSESV